MAAPRQIELIRKNDPNEEKALINPDFQQHRSIGNDRCYARPEFDMILVDSFSRPMVLDTSGGREIRRMSMTGRYLRVESRVIAGILAAPSTLVDLLYPESADYEGRYLDIDKTWHIIHFLLNNHAWEGSGALFGAVLGGTGLTDEDLVYGPPGISPRPRYALRRRH
jgi:hypothetical protein